MDIQKRAPAAVGARHDLVKPLVEIGIIHRSGTNLSIIAVKICDLLFRIHAVEDKRIAPAIKRMCSPAVQKRDRRIKPLYARLQQAGEPCADGHSKHARHACPKRAQQPVSNCRHIVFRHAKIAKRTVCSTHADIRRHFVEQRAAAIKQKQRDVVIGMQCLQQVQQRFLHTADMHIVIYDQNSFHVSLPRFEISGTAVTTARLQQAA